MDFLKLEFYFSRPRTRHANVSVALRSSKNKVTLDSSRGQLLILQKVDRK